jgi:RNA polymerase-binding transcription factor DksA
MATKKNAPAVAGARKASTTATGGRSAMPTKASTKKAVTAKKSPASSGGTTKAVATRKQAPAKVAHAPEHVAPTSKTTKKAASVADKAVPVKKKAPAKAAPSKAPAAKAPAAKAPAKAAATKSSFDAKFLASQRELLLSERANYIKQADALMAEAVSLTENREPGDVQFDEESGEGDTLAVERERDLALSAQASAAVEEIDAALERMDKGTYGICRVSGQPIPRERLKAIPWATERVEYKVGGFGRL